MTVGLPGVGLGGIFYLASALLMPVRSLIAVLRGRADEARWPLALRQAALAAGILGGVWATAWALGWIIATLPADATRSVLRGGAPPGTVHSVLRTTALAFSFGTLAVVLGLVQLLRVVVPAMPSARNRLGRARTAARPAA